MNRETVENATEENAIKNIKQYIIDCKLEGAVWKRFPEQDEGGRYCFMLYIESFFDLIHHWISMPGAPLKKVRPDKNREDVWNFECLYVDGVNGVWYKTIFSQEDFCLKNSK